MALFEYLRQVQRFAHDSKMELLDPGDLISYINKARREVAMRCQCIRVLPAISGAIVSIPVLNGGSGYTNPTVVISAPDFPNGQAPFPGGAQATAVATLLGDVVTSVNVTFGGSGYFQPVVTISDPTGTGAEVSYNLSLLNTTLANQEIYPFSAVDLSPFPGVESIYMVKSISIIFSNFRYSLPVYSFSTYQAQIRQYAFQYSYVPTIGAQFGQGTAGSMYLYPLASQPYQMEWDCLCIPSDLIDDESVEAIPMPWTEGVPFLAAYYAFNELQNLNAARYYSEEFDRWMHRYSSYARTGRVTNPYGRY